MPHYFSKKTAGETSPPLVYEDMSLVHDVFEIFLAPIVRPGTTLSVFVDHERTEDKVSTFVTYSASGGMQSKAEHTKIAKLASSLTSINKLDWRNYVLTMSIHPRAQSAHDVIEDRARLIEICDQRGMDWSKVSKEYDAMRERLVISSDGLNAA